MKVIGITGGIGSGKSTVVRFLQELGAEVIDADLIAREIAGKNSEALNEIIRYFGSGVLNEAMELDRKKLGSIVFSDPDKLKALEQITHKYIVKEIISRVSFEKQRSVNGIIVIEATVPVEHGFLDQCNEIWTVVSDIDKRIERVKVRNSIDREEILKRIALQLSENDYKRLADKVIENNGSIDELRERTICLFKEIVPGVKFSEEKQ